MKKLFVSLAVLFVLGLPAAVKADTVKIFQAPTTAANAGTGGPNQFDLDHYRAYTWSIRHTFAPGQTIVGARLIFTNIHNWDANANRLYVNMLDFARNTNHNAVDSVQDTNVDPTATNGGFSDYFDSPDALANGAEKVDLLTMSNLSMTPGTITHVFTQAQLLKLREFFSITDNTLAFGFDPDCHFWNNGIKFEMTLGTTTAPVPEPATMALLGTGLAGLYARRRRQRRKEQAAA